jgi:glutamate dehydrogenase (NAD(P)+)
MGMREEKPPALIVEYTDPREGFKGWLVMDCLDHALSAGGMRVQPGLTLEHLAAMARNMTRKMRICGLRVDGAKCGIDYNPGAPGKHAAMARFMAAIRPYVMTRYSMGPDLNVGMSELEAIGRDLGIPSVKIAVAAAQGWEPAYFHRRYQVLEQEIDGWPLGRLRAGYGVGAAVLAVLDHLEIPPDQASVAIQGFGTLARAAAYLLCRSGVSIIALADGEKCLVSTNGQGIEMQQLLKTEGPLLPRQDFGSGVRVTGREEIYRVPCDILVPAAVENAVTEQVAGLLEVKALVPGANLAVTAGGEDLLYRRGIVALPDFLAGSGGSLSMEGLFAPADHPGPAEVLAHVGQRMDRAVKQILARSRLEKISPTRAALKICGEKLPQPGARPYGE